MQIVSIGDNLHEMLNPVFWEKIKKSITNVSSAELAQKVVKVMSSSDFSLNSGKSNLLPVDVSENF